MNNKIFGETNFDQQKPYKYKTKIERLEDELLNAIRHQKKMNIGLTQRIITLENYVAFLEAERNKE